MTTELKYINSTNENYLVNIIVSIKPIQSKKMIYSSVNEQSYTLRVFGNGKNRCLSKTNTNCVHFTHVDLKVGQTRLITHSE